LARQGGSQAVFGLGRPVRRNRDGFRAALADDAPNVDLGWLEVREPFSTCLKSGEFPDGMLGLIEDWSWETFAREDCRFARAAAT
jgi:hypothetical protein